MADSAINIVVIGLGEVGEVFARFLASRGDVRLRVASRATPRSGAAALRLGSPLEHDLARAVQGADLVLLTVTAQSLGTVARQIAGGLGRTTLVADLTSAEPEQVCAASRLHPGGPDWFVDATIMGAVSMQGAATPILASGAKAQQFADTMSGLGFAVRAIPGSAVGDASRVKLMRSIFAKGLEALMVEAALAARAAGLESEFMLQLENSDRMPLREHMAMYLRTHPLHARRRLDEMEAAERQLTGSGVRSITTRAAIDRYRRTISLLEASAPDPGRLADADGATTWLLAAERAAAAPEAGPESGSEAARSTATTPSEVGYSNV